MTALHVALRDVGLAPYQAKVLAVLVEHDGPADSATIAALSGVPRTSVYATAAALRSMGIVDEIATTQSRRWEAGPWSDVVLRLRLHLEREHAARLHAVVMLEVATGG